MGGSAAAPRDANRARPAASAIWQIGSPMVDADAVLFDLDGVLVDSRVPFVRCVNAALLAHGLPAREEADLHAFIGPPLHGTFAELGAGEWVQSCVDTYRERYRTRAASETALFPGVLSMLERLGERLPMVIATSKPRALAEPLLRSLGIEGHFVAVVGPHLGAEHETKAVTIRRALDRVPASARAVMVGDRHYDIAGAKANGLPAVGALWGVGTESELTEAGADALARDPRELPELL